MFSLANIAAVHFNLATQVNAELPRVNSSVRVRREAGMFGNTLTLVFGVGLGIYLAQNYDLPDIKVLVKHGMNAAKTLEKAARKDDDSADK